MTELKNKLKRRLVASALHHPALELVAAKQRIQYAQVDIPTVESLHQPKVICLGNFKTGTVSITGLLGQQLNGTHEPHAYLYCKAWLKFQRGLISETEWEDFLIRRNQALLIDFEASGFLTIEAARLAKLFPETKFILTVREPESWVRSILRHILKNRKKLGYHYWDPAFKFYFSGRDFPPKEAPLKAQNLFPLQAMLDYWQQSNENALQAIPHERLLILDTKKLSHSVGQLERFMGWKSNTLNHATAHLHSGERDKDPLSKVPDSYINDLAAPYSDYFRELTIDSDK